MFFKISLRDIEYNFLKCQQYIVQHTQYMFSISISFYSIRLIFRNLIELLSESFSYAMV